MKKIILSILTFSLLFSITSADFEEKSVESFINSPSFESLEKIKNPVIRFCEETYLEAYMRREFTEVENEICGDFFAQKMESEYLYKRKVLGERGVY